MKYAKYTVLWTLILSLSGCEKPEPEPPFTFSISDDSAAPHAWLSVERQGKRVERIVIDVDEVLRTQRGEVSGGIIAEVTHQKGKVVIEFSDKP